MPSYSFAVGPSMETQSPDTPKTLGVDSRSMETISIGTWVALGAFEPMWLTRFLV